MKALTYIEHGKFALLAKCQTWGELNPVTRKPVSSKAYNRNKARNWKRDYHEPVPGLSIFINSDISFSS